MGTGTDYFLGKLGLKSGTGFSTMDRYISLYERKNSLKGKELLEFKNLDKMFSSDLKDQSKKQQIKNKKFMI